MKTRELFLRESFSAIEERELPESFFPKLFSRIDMEKKMRASRERLTALCGVVLSSVFFCFALFGYSGSIFQSEFWSILSLVFSDGAILLHSWRDFGLLLLETAPIFSLIILLFPIFLFLVSVELYSHAILQRARHPRYHFI